MQDIKQILETSQLRYTWDDTHKKWWFSTIDICAILCGSNYQKARNYWKWLKRKLYNEGNQLVSVTTQLKFVASDGKCRYTDVMDASDVMKLIEVIPSKNAAPFKEWVKNLAATEFEGQLAEAVTKADGKSREEIEKSECKRQGFMKVTRIVRVYDVGPDWDKSLPEEEMPRQMRDAA